MSLAPYSPDPSPLGGYRRRVVSRTRRARSIGHRACVPFGHGVVDRSACREAFTPSAGSAPRSGSRGPVASVSAMWSQSTNGVSQRPADDGPTSASHHGGAVGTASARGAAGGRGPRCARPRRRRPRRRRAAMSSARKRTCVAHAGSSTSTSSVPCSSRTGRTLAAIAGPTASSQRPNTPPTSARPAPPRSDRSSPSRASVDRHRVVVAHRCADARSRRRGRRRSLVDDRRRRATSRSTRSGRCAAARAPPHAVVITTCPAGRWPSSAVGPAGVELGQHVVEHEHRRRAGALGDQAVGGQAQRQRQRALLALRGVGARRQSVDRQRRARRGAARRSTRRAARRRRAPRPAPRPGRSRRHGGS